MNYLNNTGNKFDLLIPLAEKNITELMNGLPYILKNIDAETIYVVASIELKQCFRNYPQIKFIDEDGIIEGLSFQYVKQIIETIYPKAGRRTGWYFQQFLKLGYSRVCENQYYLIWDSDTIPLKPVTFFDDRGRPYLDYRQYVSEDKEYFRFIDRLWPDGSIKKRRKESFITEHMMFDAGIVQEMLDEIEQKQELKGKLFFEKILSAISKDSLNLSGFSEYETYAAYIDCRKKNHYTMRLWKNLRWGKIFFGCQPSEAQLKWAGENFCAVSIEHFNHQWAICKCFNKQVFMNNISFRTVYGIFNPIIILIKKIRLTVRAFIRR